MFYFLLNNVKSIFENFFADAAFKELFIDFRKTIFIIKLLNRIQKIVFTNRKKEKKKKKKREMIDPTIFLQSGGLQEQTMKERNVQIIKNILHEHNKALST